MGHIHLAILLTFYRKPFRHRALREAIPRYCFYVLLNGLFSRIIPVHLLLGIFFFSAALVILFNIATDLVYRLADPRIKGAAA